MGRPCTHESLGGKQGKLGGLVVQTQEPDRYRRIRTCLPGEVEASSSPIRRGCEISGWMECRRTGFRMGRLRVQGRGSHAALCGRIPQWVIVQAVQSGSGRLHNHQGKNCRMASGSAMEWLVGRAHHGRSPSSEEYVESHNNFFEEKLAEFKTEMRSWIDDFKETLQSYGEDIAILKKAVLRGSPQPTSLFF
ncbi:hypothetical protein AAG906_000345 [Vitis piasezkii]